MRFFERFALERDGLGRIKRIPHDSKLQWGHSVCNVCGKDMPKVWDEVCYGCGRTFCSDHTLLKDDYWFCEECAESQEVYQVLTSDGSSSGSAWDYYGLPRTIEHRTKATDSCPYCGSRYDPNHTLPNCRQCGAPKLTRGNEDIGESLYYYGYLT